MTKCTSSEATTTFKISKDEINARFLNNIKIKMGTERMPWTMRLKLSGLYLMYIVASLVLVPAMSIIKYYHKLYLSKKQRK